MVYALTMLASLSREGPCTHMFGTLFAGTSSVVRPMLSNNTVFPPRTCSVNSLRAMAMGYNAHGQCDIPVLYTQASTEVDHFEVVSKLLPAVTKTLNHVASQY